MDVRHSSGLISELTAARYFAQQGYEIFWPVNTQSRIDFIVLKGGKTSRVQVKTAPWSKVGTFSYLQCRLSTRDKKSRPMYKAGDFDLVVFTSHCGRMWAVPLEAVCDLTSVTLATSNPKPVHRRRKYNMEVFEVTRKENNEQDNN